MVQTANLILAARFSYRLQRAVAYGKSTLRFFAPSITSTEARGATGVGAFTAAGSTLTLRAGFDLNSGFGCSLFNEPGSGAGVACSPSGSVRLLTPMVCSSPWSIE